MKQATDAENTLMKAISKYLRSKNMLTVYSDVERQGAWNFYVYDENIRDIIVDEFHENALIAALRGCLEICEKEEQCRTSSTKLDIRSPIR